jgi:hypothetical protein
VSRFMLAVIVAFLFSTSAKADQDQECRLSEGAKMKTPTGGYDGLCHGVEYTEAYCRSATGKDFVSYSQETKECIFYPWSHRGH